MKKQMDRRSFLKTSAAAAVCAELATSNLLAAGVTLVAPHAEKLGWRLGCCAYTFNYLTFYETIDKAASLGLNVLVGFNWQRLSPQKPDAKMSEHMSAADRNETRKRMADAGVKLACCYCDGWDKEDACRRLFDFASEMGIETIDSDPPNEAFLDTCERLCDEHQINLAVHNHAKPSLDWQPETLMKLFAGRSKRIGACCDTGHWARSGLNAIECLRTLEGRILTFDLKDVDAKGRCVPLGTGRANIDAILGEINRERFRGVLGIEYDQPGAKLESEIAQCAAYVERVSQELTAKGSRHGERQ